MQNLMSQDEGNSIYTFKKGDIIVRLKNARMIDIRTNENLGIEVEILKGEDSSFRDEPVEFIAIENNLIYLRSLRTSLFKDHIYKVRVERYEDNWAIYKVPEGLTMDDCI